MSARDLATLSALALAALVTVGCEPALPLGSSRGEQGTRPLRLLMQRTTDETFDSFPVVTDGQRLFAQTRRGELIALDAESGDPLWKIPAIGADIPAGQPVVEQGVVVVPSELVRAFDAATGAPRWEVPLPFTGEFGLPVAEDGVVYFGTDTLLYALDVQTGAERWRAAVGAAWPHGGYARALTYHEGMLYLCGQSLLEPNGFRTAGAVAAIDAATGERRWEYEMRFEDDFSYCVGEPLVAGDALILSDFGSNNVVAVDRATGAFRWRRRGAEGWVGPWTPPAWRGDTLFAALGDGDVIALDRRSGATLWRTAVGGTMKTTERCGSVLLAHDYRLHVLDPRTGTVRAADVTADWPNAGVVVSRFLVRGDTAWVFGVDYLAKMLCPR